MSVPISDAGVCAARYRSSSVVDFFAMPDSQHKHNKAIVLDLTDQPERTDSIFPEFAEARALQRLADAARIFEPGQPIAKEFEDPAAVLSVELLELTVRRGG
jgi:hypothetical protein